MNDHHSPSASRLLRDATDDLAVDADRIVRGGIARGRTLRRRRRVGTTLAAAAVVGVIGVAASVGPGLLGDDAPTGGGPGFATGTTATAPTTPLPSTTPASSPPVAPSEPDAAVKVAAQDVPDVFGEVLGGDVGEILTDDEYGIVDEPEHKIVHFLYDDTLTTFIIERADTLAGCAAMVDPANQPDGQPGGECVFVDGIETLSWGPDTADGVTGQGVMAWQHGYVVSALSYNAADGKDNTVVADVPPISLDELLGLATTDTWFEVGAPGQTAGAPEAMLMSTQIPALLTAVEPGDLVPSEEAGGYVDSPTESTAHVLLNGMLVSAGISPAQGDPMTRCLQRFPQPRSTCRELDDGSVIADDDTFAAVQDGGAQAASAYLFRTGYDVFATSYNAAAPIGGEVLSAAPPITHDELEQVVTSDDWVR